MTSNCFLLELTLPVYGSTQSYDATSYLFLSEGRKNRTKQSTALQFYLIFFLRRVPTLRTQRR